jgi:hypothetical protein
MGTTRIGWLRTWALISACWVILVAVLGIRAWQDHREPSPVPSVYDELSPGARPYFDRGEPGRVEPRFSQLLEFEDGSETSLEFTALEIDELADFNDRIARFAADRGKTVSPAALMRFRQAVWESNERAIEARQEITELLAERERQGMRQRNRTYSLFAAGALLPPVIAFALGVVIAWIRHRLSLGPRPEMTRKLGD